MTLKLSEEVVTLRSVYEAAHAARLRDLTESTMRDHMGAIVAGLGVPSRLLDPRTQAVREALIDGVLRGDAVSGLALRDWLRDHDEWGWPVIGKLVRRHKSCDEFRLMAADWFAEQGQPDRSNFIRLQVKLQQHRYAEEVREWQYKSGLQTLLFGEAVDLHDEEMRLLWHRSTTAPDCANWSSWCWAEARNEEGEPVRAGKEGSFTVTPHLTSGLGDNSCGCSVDTSAGLVKQTWRRGFVARISCTLKTWLAVGPRIVSEHPIERVTLGDRRPVNYDEGQSHWWNPTPASNVPNELPSDWFREFKPGAAARFPTYEEALLWASTRAIEWAEKQSCSL